MLCAAYVAKQRGGGGGRALQDLWMHQTGSDSGPLGLDFANLKTFKPAKLQPTRLFFFLLKRHKSCWTNIVGYQIPFCVCECFPLKSVKWNCIDLVNSLSFSLFLPPVSLAQSREIFRFFSNNFTFMVLQHCWHFRFSYINICFWRKVCVNCQDSPDPVWF